MSEIFPLSCRPHNFDEYAKTQTFYSHFAIFIIKIFKFSSLAPQCRSVLYSNTNTGEGLEEFSRSLKLGIGIKSCHEI